VVPEHRGGFLDMWEATNELEFTTHPYYGTIWDRDGNEINFKDEYRVDFLTDRAEKFLRQKQEKPFLLVISQIEPHQQNDLKRMVGPKGSAERFINAYVPGPARVSGRLARATAGLLRMLRGDRRVGGTGAEDSG
jgi:hypothetical protein